MRVGRRGGRSRAEGAVRSATSSEDTLCCAPQPCRLRTGAASVRAVQMLPVEVSRWLASLGF